MLKPVLLSTKLVDQTNCIKYAACRWNEQGYRNGERNDRWAQPVLLCPVACRVKQCECVCFADENFDNWLHWRIDLVLLRQLFWKMEDSEPFCTNCIGRSRHQQKHVVEGRSIGMWIVQQCYAHRLQWLVRICVLIVCCSHLCRCFCSLMMLVIDCSLISYGSVG